MSIQNDELRAKVAEAMYGKLGEPHFNKQSALVIWDMQDVEDLAQVAIDTCRAAEVQPERCADMDEWKDRLMALMQQQRNESMEAGFQMGQFVAKLEGIA